MVRQGAGIPVAVARRPLAPVVTGGGFLHARSIYERTQVPHPHKERTMSDTRMDVLGLMAAAEPLWRTACDDYSEGEEPSIIRAQLELHRHAVTLILERMETR